MFVPLEHPPGDAQADFGEAMVVIGGVERKAHYLAVDLPQSDDCFVMAFPAETTEALLEAINNYAFAYFGGVPRTILYDNTKLAVARILGDGTRMKTRAFTELQSHYLFAEKFGRPGKGNDKGKRGRVGRLCATELHGTGSAIRHLGGVQRASSGPMPEAAQRKLQRTPADHRRALRQRQREAVAAAGGCRTKPATNVRLE